MRMHNSLLQTRHQYAYSRSRRIKYCSLHVVRVGEPVFVRCIGILKIFFTTFVSRDPLLICGLFPTVWDTVLLHLSSLWARLSLY